MISQLETAFQFPSSTVFTYQSNALLLDCGNNYDHVREVANEFISLGVKIITEYDVSGHVLVFWLTVCLYPQTRPLNALLKTRKPNRLRCSIVAR